MITNNQVGATGDGIYMAQDVGANVIDMEQIQAHPTVEQSTATLVTEGVRKARRNSAQCRRSALYQ